MSEADTKENRHATISEHITGAADSKDKEIVEDNQDDLEIQQNVIQSNGNAFSTHSRPPSDIDIEPDADSEAETLIQSPEKKREMAELSKIAHQTNAIVTSDNVSSAAVNTSDKENVQRKRRRSKEDDRSNVPVRGPSRHSSPLSSPLQQVMSDVESTNSSEHSLESHLQQDFDSSGASPEPKEGHTHRTKRRRRPSELTTTSLTRKRAKRNSSDTLERRETRSATFPKQLDGESLSSPDPPSRREHRRVNSTQIPVDGERRKRGRPPAIHTRRNASVSRDSDSEDDSEPAKRPRTNLHKLALMDHDTMSPAKVGPRKWKDKNGRTFLARACANQDLDLARAKLIERPEDLNMPDNAGNTPLQIASLEGFEDVVEFLLSKGADVNMRNLDKDTPLIDAVENGHLKVVKLLLAYGANPRLGNAKGDEPLELTPEDDENVNEIRRLLQDAKDKDLKKKPAVEEQDQTRDGTESRAASAASPRDSPPIGPRSPPAIGSRRRTGRSESTRNDLLWLVNTPENLAKLSAKGDAAGVASILSILGRAETESVIAAAKAGHEETLQLLIAMGNPVPDPEPVRNGKFTSGYDTPMLAAIGRGHPDVVKLLVTQSGFNPTRRHNHRTYYDLAQDRKGSRWQEEYDILKRAYDKYKASRIRKNSSPRKTRDIDKMRRLVRRSSSVGSPSRTPSPELKRKDSSGRQDRKDKLRVSRDTADLALATASDVEVGQVAQKATHRTRRSHSDLPPMVDSDGDGLQKRRRLMTGKEHRNRHTVNTSSDVEEVKEVRVKQEDQPQPALKRVRRDTTSPEAHHKTNAGESKDPRKKRRTIPDSSPEVSRRSADAGVAPLESSLDPQISLASLTSAIGQDTNTRPAEQSSVPDTIEQIKDEPTISIDPTDFPQTQSAVQLQQTVEPLNLASTHKPLDLLPPPRTATARTTAEPETFDASKAAEQSAQEQHRQEEEKRLQTLELDRLREKEEEEAAIAAAAAAAAELVREKQRQEDEERSREIENKQRLAQIEAERQRRESLPVVLARTAQMIDEDDPRVRGHEWLSRFLPLYTVRTRQLDPHCDPSDEQNEWLPNFQAVCLLCSKDLGLLSLTSMHKRAVTDHERYCLWRVARLKLSYDFNPAWTTPVSKATELESIAQEKFMSMAELFWVRLSDFMEQVPQFPHLSSLNLHRQPISLKSYTDILTAKQNHVEHKPVLINGIMSPSTENGINGTS